MRVRFALLTLSAAEAAITYVGASPLRVVFVSSSHQTAPSIQTFPSDHAQLAVPDHSATAHSLRLWGSQVEDKAIQLSNAFRHALGLPLVETGQSRPGDHVHGGIVHIMPFVETPPTLTNFRAVIADHLNGQRVAHLKEPCQTVHRPSHRFRKWGNTFMTRIHNSLMALGPWEGRVVAFVLGCGIGVLLRMFWILAVVTYRSVRGGHADEYTQVGVIEEYTDAEDVVVPPPTYTVGDEKDQTRAKDAPEN